MKRIFFILVLVNFIFSCVNPAYEGVISPAEYEEVKLDRLKGLVFPTAPRGNPSCIQFTKEGFTIVEDKSSKDWHLYTVDASWRFSSNSGSTGVYLRSHGLGGVKVFKDVTFDSIKSISHTEGLVGGDPNYWEIDYYWDYAGFATFNHLTLNAYLTGNVVSCQSHSPDFLEDPSLQEFIELQHEERHPGTDFCDCCPYHLLDEYSDGVHASAEHWNTATDSRSETYLFEFEGTQMSSGLAYQAGSQFIFIVKDGNGKNYVKLQPIEIGTDGEGMTYENRVYTFKYEMATEDGNFLGETE